jgi:hypothetical protein
MKKAFKKILTLAFVSGLGFLGYKIFRLIKDAIELEKFLPKFFESHVGEKPVISLMLNLTGTTLSAKFSKDTIEKNPDLEKSILDYVNNYYSSFCMDKFKVVVLEKDEEAEETIIEEVKPEETKAEPVEIVEEKPLKETEQPKKDTIEKTEKVKPPSKPRMRKPRKKNTE